MCPRASGHCDMGLPARMINLEVASSLAAKGGEGGRIVSIAHYLTLAHTVTPPSI